MANSVRSFLVDPRDAGLRVDQFLAEKLTDLTRIGIGNLIAAGKCAVNGELTRAGYHLSAGDSIELRVDEELPGAMSPDRIPLEILFEDDQLLVVVKPAGMLVHPTRSVKRGTLANALTYYLNTTQRQINAPQLPDEAESLLARTGPVQPIVRPGLVHRLDRATSGLMVVAKNQRALSLLSRHFSRRLVEKRYLALVRGFIEPDDGSVEAPVGRDPVAVPHWRVLDSGRPAETRFRVVERRSNTTLVELQPLTGRTNQLRIHMAFIGHPIVGDESWDRAGPREAGETGEDGALSPIDAPSAARLMLHASMLAFHHPVGGEWMKFTSAPPAEFDLSSRAGTSPQAIRRADENGRRDRS